MATQYINHRVVQRRTAHRLGEESLNIVFDIASTRFAHLIAGHQHDRRRIARYAQLTGQGQTVQIGQAPVEQNQIEAHPPPQDRLHVESSADRDSLASESLDAARQQGAHHLAVIDHQHPFPHQWRAGGQGVIFAGDQRQGQRDAEGGALVRCAADFDAAPHAFHQLLADDQPQPGPPVFSGRRAVGLGKRVEQTSQLLGRHAYPRIIHDKAQRCRHTRCSGRLDSQFNPAMCGEFEGISGQIGEDLGQPQGIADKPIGNLGLGADHQFDALFAGLLAEQVGDVVQYLAQAERHRLDDQLASLDFREIQNVIDDAEQGLGCAMGFFDIVAGTLGQFLAQAQLGKTQHGIDRGTNLVAHVCQEGALGERGSFSLIARLAQCLIGALALGDIAIRYAAAERLTRRIPDGLAQMLDPAHFAILVLNAVFDILYAATLALMQMFEQAGAIVVVGDLEIQLGPRHELLGAIAGDALTGGRAIQPVAGSVDPGFPVIGEIGDGAVACFRFAQGGSSFSKHVFQMMPMAIEFVAHVLLLGNVFLHCYVVRDAAVRLADGGEAGKLDIFAAILRRLMNSPCQACPWVSASHSAT